MRRIVGPRCTICNHPARPQIDLAIATGVAKRAVAERFGVSRDAVWRHAQAHLTAEMRAALATKLLQREGDTRRIQQVRPLAGARIETQAMPLLPDRSFVRPPRGGAGSSNNRACRVQRPRGLVG